MHFVNFSNIESATGFIKPGRVVDIAAEIVGVRDPYEISRRCRNVAQVRDKLKGELVGIKVKTIHNPEVPRKYGVIGISRKPMREETFPVEENGRTREKRLVDYYREVYNWNLKYLDLPCLQVGKKEKKTFLPMEVIFFDRFV
jgi:eukaryotic translation initiation factor 2C